MVTCGGETAVWVMSRASVGDGGTSAKVGLRAGERPARPMVMSDFAPSLVRLTIRGTATASRPVWGRPRRHRPSAHRRLGPRPPHRDRGRRSPASSTDATTRRPRWCRRVSTHAGGRAAGARRADAEPGLRGFRRCRPLRAWPGALVVASHDRELDAIGIERHIALAGRARITRFPFLADATAIPGRA